MRLVTLSLALILATQAANAANERWTTYQGNAHHTGFVDENLAVAATPVLRWSKQLHAVRIDGIAVGDLRISAIVTGHFG